MNELIGILGVLFVPAVFVIGYFLLSWVRIFQEYERGVKFSLGRLQRRAVGPGPVLLVFPPFVDRVVKVDMRTVTLDVPPQDVVTKDNISIKVNAVIYYRVLEPIKAITEVENYGFATSQIAQTTLRSIVGHFELDQVLSQRDEISNRIQSIVDEHTDPWGIKVLNVELKHIEIPHDMQRAIARQAEAERERRSKIISAEGEFQAAEKLVQAAKLMETSPMALQMRYLQTLLEISAENSSTVIFPLPMDIIKPFLESSRAPAPQGPAPSSQSRLPANQPPQVQNTAGNGGTYYS
jgi:regulator of protease activity HflC (stomatin/prohibitin superfamily)